MEKCINNVGDSQSLLISITTKLTSTTIVVMAWKSVYHTYGYGSLYRHMYVIHSIACSLCYVESIATMLVHNYAGS